MEQWERNIRLLGQDGQQRLMQAKVAVFGLGGVGGFAAEALVRAGVGHLLFVDGDVVEISNLNRQILATHDTLGRPKAEVMKERALSIAPDARIEALQVFFDEKSAHLFDFREWDYVIDAIDSVPSKILLIECCRQANAPIISAMGAGNKLDPTRFRVTDLAKTSVCPLARTMRSALRKRGIEHLKVVFSDEPPLPSNGQRAPGSVSFVPSVAGLILAGEVIREIAGLDTDAGSSV